MMIYNYFKRLWQVSHYGKLHAKKIATENNLEWQFIYCDIKKCYRKYKMWSNEYLKEKFWALSEQERDVVGAKYYEKNIAYEEWLKDFDENCRFMRKYMTHEFEPLRLRPKRTAAYAKRYNMGKNCFVEYGVEISRRHGLNGTIKVGNNVLFAKNVFVDYSGGIEIKDNVQLANGVSVLTHHHPFHSDYRQPRSATPSPLVIEEDVIIGTRAIIMDTCNYIGKHARIGAGAVVTKDVPDYAIVVGCPAKVVRMMP